MLALCLVGCGGSGDLPVDTAADTTVPPDTSPAQDTDDTSAAEVVPETIDTAAGPDTSAEVTPDTAHEVTVCGSVACDAPPSPGCSPDRLAAWTYGDDAACNVDGNGFPLCSYPVSDTRCGEGEACRVDGDGPLCAPPRTTCEVALSRLGTWISAAHLPASDGEACCFDFDGDGEVDNGLADLAQALAPLFDANAQDFIDAFIQRGLNAYLLQYRRLDGIASDADVGVDLLLGFDEDGNYADNLLGTERFAVRTASYDGPSPRSSFNSASFMAFVLRARSSSLAFPLPLTDAPLNAGLGDVRIDARATIGDNGRGLALGAVADDVLGARFGALFPLSEVYRAINAFARESCACLDLAGGELVVSNGGGWQCRTAGSSACNPGDPDEAACIDLASYCGAVLVLLKPDVADSISIGLWIQGVSAGFGGFVDAAGEQPLCP